MPFANAWNMAVRISYQKLLLLPKVTMPVALSKLAAM
jgi:hypothetical protein